MVITLEGGYDLGVLRDSVKTVLRELADQSRTNYEDMISRADQGKLEHTVNQVLQIHGQYWKSLNP